MLLNTHLLVIFQGALLGVQYSHWHSFKIFISSFYFRLNIRSIILSALSMFNVSVCLAFSFVIVFLFVCLLSLCFVCLFTFTICVLIPLDNLIASYLSLHTLQSVNYILNRSYSIQRLSELFCFSFFCLCLQNWLLYVYFFWFYSFIRNKLLSHLRQCSGFLTLIWSVDKL